MKTNNVNVRIQNVDIAGRGKNLRERNENKRKRLVVYGKSGPYAKKTKRRVIV